MKTPAPLTSASPKELLASIKLPEATWIGIRQVVEIEHSRSARDGKIDRSSQRRNEGVMIEVLSQGQFGYASTSDLSPSAIQLAAELALTQAKRASRYALHSFTPDARPAVKGNYRSPFLKPLSSLSASDWANLLVEISAKLKNSHKIVRTDASSRAIESTTRYASSSGAEFTQELLLFSLDFAATAQDGPLTQRRSDSVNLQAGLEILSQEDLWSRVERVAAQSVELLSAPDCPTETTHLVLMPSQMTLQIHESIGHPLELDRILGDERNYAGWSFVRPQDFGKLVYGSSLMNVTFDPTVAGEFASYRFDDGGAPATREYLIRNGVLERGLGGVESQRRLALPGVANFRASSWNRPPVDRMANINLEPGTSSFDEIISSIEEGVLMDTNRSWSIDDYRNKFQFGCEYAKKIKNGKIMHTLKNPNYRGVTTPFWKGLKKVGNLETTETHGTPNCGKAEPNQIIRVGHRSPVCLFENVEVFGGGA
jgi:predicted Zn-dependent protease